MPRDEAAGPVDDGPGKPVAAPVPVELGDPMNYVFASAPVNVYWETTIACDLACQHCRASAMPQRSEDELGHQDAIALVEAVRELGSTLIFTGGDPLKRPDLWELLDHGRTIGLTVGVTPAATPLLTRDVVRSFVERRIAMMGMSLDAGDARTQDEFRGVPGTFDRTIQALAWAGEMGLGVQINSTVTRQTVAWLPAIYDRLCSLPGAPVRRWSLFFLIPTGRGASIAMPTRQQVQQTFAWVRNLGRAPAFQITTVEAPMYRRYALEADHAAGATWDEILLGTRARRGLGIRDGNGVLFVSHRGDVYPSGFLPTPVLGNVRETRLSAIYRDSRILRQLRNPDGFTGICGRCDFRWICGGSRARAYAMTGDLFGPDPLCPFVVG